MAQDASTTSIEHHIPPPMVPLTSNSFPGFFVAASTQVSGNFPSYKFDSVRIDLTPLSQNQNLSISDVQRELDNNPLPGFYAKDLVNLTDNAPIYLNTTPALFRIDFLPISQVQQVPESSSLFGVLVLGIFMALLGIYSSKFFQITSFKRWRSRVETIA